MRDEGALTVVPDAGERSFDTALREEMEYLLASETFRKSPKLSQLLAYLVGATLRGEGEALKSYTVAVEGLGRDPDFDAQADSYPRVQVMRLRNFLGSFYARYEPRNEMCIYILPGSYRVRLAKFAIAYPDIVVRDARRRLTPSFQNADGSAAPAPRAVPPTYPNDNIGPAVEAAGSPAVSSAPAPATQQSRSLRWMLAAAVIVAIAAISALLYATMWKPDSSGRARDKAPTILVAKIDAPSDSQSIDLAMEIRHALIDGFSRSWTVNTLEVHGDQHEEGVMGDYTVAAAISQNRNNSRSLQISITDEAADLTIWSRNFPIDETKELPDQLALALARMASPLGVIGDRELAKSEGQKLDNYSCMLATTHALSQYTFEESKTVRECLSKPMKDRRLEVARLASTAMLTFSTSPIRQRAEAATKAENLAQQAIETDPSEVTGYYAMAWLKYIQQECEAGNAYAARTFRLYSYGPIYLVSLAGFAEDCSYPDAPRIVEMAFATMEAGNSSLRPLAVNLALKHDRKDVLAALGTAPRISSAKGEPALELSDALIAAYFNDVPDAKRHWAAYVALRKMPNASPEQLLQTSIFSNSTRQRVLSLLRERGVIASAP